jgi:hypothetical protein
MTQAFGVVHVLVSRETPQHGLSQHSDERMPAVLAGACIGEHLARRRGKAERVVEFPVGEQSRVGGDHRSTKLEHQPAVEVELATSPFNSPAGFAMTASLDPE